VIPSGAPARFPGYDVLGQRRTWDDATAAVVLGRLGPPPPVRFFTAVEEPTARALVDRLLGQDDEPRVPVLEMIDLRLVEGIGDGYRYERMPEDGEAWRRSIAALDADAFADRAGAFHTLDRAYQMDVIERVQVADGDWHGMPAARVFNLWMRYACTAFYAHPWAWNEIGFGGPAYPRGYANLGIDRRERWERAERDQPSPVPWADRADAAKKAHAERR
jgi:Gluconate 2-dehydrogenase subunit 3